MAEAVSADGSGTCAHWLPFQRVSAPPDPETPAFIRAQMSVGDTALSAAKPRWPDVVNGCQACPLKCTPYGTSVPLLVW